MPVFLAPWPGRKLALLLVEMALWTEKELKAPSELLQELVRCCVMLNEALSKGFTVQLQTLPSSCSEQGELG